MTRVVLVLLAMKKTTQFAYHDRGDDGVMPMRVMQGVVAMVTMVEINTAYQPSLSWQEH